MKDGLDAMDDRMSAETQVNISPPKKRLSPTLILSAAIASVCGAHIGNVVGLFPPYPGNALGVLGDAIFTWTTAIRLIIATILLIAWNRYAIRENGEEQRSLFRWNSARLLHGDRLELLGFAVIGLCVLPIVWAVYGMALMVTIVASMLVFRFAPQFLDAGAYGRVALVIAWFAMGLMTSTAVTAEAPGMNLTCKPGASITLKSGETLACRTISQLHLYDDILLIRGDTAARFVWPADVVADNVTAATNDWAIMLFDD